ncbi:MAG TPA: lamin tail domain-containing protein, partial [Verrucomicrobiales bacterium]|nr:lamin tail domain-containing protein [Verrucomicrobiales bacterium]
MKRPLLSLCLLAAAAAPARAQVVISEFMADNTHTLADENGSYEDWIELHNTTAAAVNLEGWALTDTAATPDKWTFPAGVTLSPNGYLIVWASNKNRRTPGSPLHTNFKLDSEGEYLALIKPDLSVASEFAPSFPPQLPDTSYGPAAQTTKTLAIQLGTTGKVLVPVDGSLGTTWTASDFIDTAWTNATNGIGFETGANEFGSFTPGNLQDGPAG